MAFVDRAEVIEVEDQHGDQVFLGLGQGQGVFQVGARQQAIGQVGQRIMMRQMTQARLALAQAGGVSLTVTVYCRVSRG